LVSYVIPRCLQRFDLGHVNNLIRSPNNGLMPCGHTTSGIVNHIGGVCIHHSKRRTPNWPPTKWSPLHADRLANPLPEITFDPFAAQTNEEKLERDDDGGNYRYVPPYRYVFGTHGISGQRNKLNEGGHEARRWQRRRSSQRVRIGKRRGPPSFAPVI
jgi:hypothetical protein